MPSVPHERSEYSGRQQIEVRHRSFQKINMCFIFERRVSVQWRFGASKSSYLAVDFSLDHIHKTKEIHPSFVSSAYESLIVLNAWLSRRLETMAPSASTKKKRAIFIGIGVTLMAVVIIVPIAIEVSQDKNEPPSTIGNRIECFPLGESNCKN